MRFRGDFRKFSHLTDVIPTGPSASKRFLRLASRTGGTCSAAHRGLEEYFMFVCKRPVGEELRCEDSGGGSWWNLRRRFHPISVLNRQQAEAKPPSERRLETNHCPSLPQVFYPNPYSLPSSQQCDVGRYLAPERMGRFL